MSKSIFVVAVIAFKLAVSSSVDKIIFEVAQITFKGASVADISLLVAKITFAMSEIIIKEDVITSQMINKLSVILTELLLNIHFSVLAAQICIKMARGIFFQMVKIANRFLQFFSKQDTSIRSIFLRVHENTIFRLD